MASITTMIESCIEDINHTLDKLKKSLLLGIWQLGKELDHCSPFRKWTLYEPLQMPINKPCCLKIYLLSHHLPATSLHPSSYFFSSLIKIAILPVTKGPQLQTSWVMNRSKLSKLLEEMLLVWYEMVLHFGKSYDYGTLIEMETCRRI